MQDALQEIIKKYDGLVLVKKLAFPLSELTFRATEAVLCVKNSGQRKKMSDLIYKNQLKWRNNRYPESLWKTYAKDSGENLTEWKKCIERRDGLGRINKSRDLGLGLGVRGTPTFFVGDKKLVGSKSIGRLKKVVESHVSKFRKRAN